MRAKSTLVRTLSSFLSLHIWLFYTCDQCTPYFSSAFVVTQKPSRLHPHYRITTTHDIGIKSAAEHTSRVLSSFLQEDDNSESIISEQKPSKCPFSMTFPRYQIQLTRGKEARDKNRNSNSSQQKASKSIFSFPLITDVSTSLAKSILKNTSYKKDNDNGNFLWRDCNDEKISTHFAENIHSVATFWEVVNDFQLELDASQSNNSLEVRKILALPDSSFQTIRGLVEILEWYNEELSFHHQSNHFVHATVDPESSVPVIIFTGQKHEGRMNSDNINSNKYNFDPKADKSFNPSIIQSRIKSWVKRILVDEKICPFTKSINRSGQGLSDLGVPVGKIYYSTSSSNPTNIPLLMADSWQSILHMMTAGPSGKEGISSILLAAPGFDDDFKIWAGPIFCMLEACVGACQGEKQVGVVCFHPDYKTPDGKSWPGFGHMHSVPRLLKWVNEFKEVTGNDNIVGDDQDRQWSKEDASAGGAWQRRTPHAVINVLRADQLEMAEGRRQTGLLYSRNIRVLVGDIGLNRLKDDLDKERTMQ